MKSKLSPKTAKVLTLVMLVSFSLFSISANSATLNNVTFNTTSGTTGIVSATLANTPTGSVTAVVIPSAPNTTPSVFTPLTAIGRVVSFSYNAQFSGTYTVYYNYTFGGGPTQDIGTFQRLSAPTLNAISPTSGIVTATGLPAQIIGSGLSAVNLVLIGGVPAIITGVSNTSVSILIPSTIPSGLNTVNVYSNSNLISTPLYFTKQAPPTITRLSPTSAAAGASTLITITGTGLTGTTAILFGSTPATTFTLVSDSQIQVATPTSLQKGASQLTLIHPLGNVTSKFDFFSNLTISSLSQTSGDIIGGNTLTIIGSGLSDTTSIRFGDVVVRNFIVNSDSSLSVVVPPGSKVGLVTLTVSSANVSASASYTYIAIPKLLLVSPSQMMENRRVKLRVTGTNLGRVLSVRFNGILARVYRDGDSNTFSTYPPVNFQPGPVTISVTTANGSASIQYTVIGKPKLDSVNLKISQMLANSRVVLTGSNLAGVTRVVVNGLSARDIQVLSPTQVAVTLPRTVYRNAFFRVYVGTTTSNLLSVYE